MGVITREAIKKLIIGYTEEMDVLRAKEGKTPKDEVRFMDLNTLIDTANNVLKDPDKYEVKFND